MFFLSGASSLIYEVVWTRQLTTFFGSTLYGVTSVVTSFMGGLALGSFLAGKKADKMRRPLMVYGIMELVIGVCALVFPHLLNATQPIVGGFYATGGSGSFYAYSLIRFVLVFLLLIVPTTLMGATLPLISKAVTTQFSHVGRSLGTLYAINTAGAVAGVFAAGFFLLERYGLLGTTLVSVALNVGIGIVACAVGGRAHPLDAEVVAEHPGELDESSADPLPPSTARLVIATYMLAGFVSLAFQVCWTRAMIFGFDSLKSTTYSFSGMLVVFLVGLAAGSAIMQRIVDWKEDLLRLYAWLMAGIGVFGGFSFFMILTPLAPLQELDEHRALIYWNAVANVMYKTAATIGLPTLLMGMMFPVVAKLAVRSLRVIGSDVGRVYAANTVGAIAGSFAAGFILIPLLGITKLIALLSTVSLLGSAALFGVNSQLAPRTRSLLAAGAILAAIIIPLRVGFSDAKLQRIQANEKIVHYEEGAMATISVVENNSGDRMIYVDDVGVAGTDKIMLTDQKSLAHVPMMLLGGKAESTLSVGFGSGGASYSYTLYPGIKHIHTIEIAPEVLRAAPTLTDSNHGIILPDALYEEAGAAGATSIAGFVHPLSAYKEVPVKGFRTFDPRFKVLLDDARSYLRFTKMQYDVIATDCTDLRYKSNANLYDLEYFTLCRKAISDRGLVVVWMPLGGLSDRAYRVALRTFQEVFPNMSVWYFTNQPTHYCLLIGSKNDFKIDYEQLKQAVEMPGISKDLNEIGLRDPDKLISSFVCDQRTLGALLKGFPLNTENNPIIEFESPLYGYDSRPLHDNQDLMYKNQVPAGDLLTNVVGEDPSGRIWQLQQANYVVFKGHSAYRLYDFAQACRLYQKALAMVPWDDSIRRLLDFEELRVHYETAKSHASSNTVLVGQSLADIYFLQDRIAEAVTMAEDVLPAAEQLYSLNQHPEIRRALFDLHVTLAKCYQRVNNEKKFKANAEAAEKYAVDDAERKLIPQ
ncbi:fused MFS/spermidine synthase [Candidatus Sumerlaeota bacterium]|nr:fused MFS/spermidine synthase [Candidatus Sumerlaeota bacterium]